MTWRNALYTFADESRKIYTVTNVPPIVHPISTAIDPSFLANRSLSSLLRPHLSVHKYPELPFLLRKLPVTDPLLSRLGADVSSLVPNSYEDGWALADDLRAAWISLENGLLYISELLLTSTEQSSCGTSARYAIRYQEHWPPPEDYGYRKLHPSLRSAQVSINRAHDAFQILAARCALAIALWEFPGPVRGGSHLLKTSRPDSDSATVVPDWVDFLRISHVPSSWIDAISDSVISNFSLGLRVGTVLDPADCLWLPIAPVLRAANVPVFVLWHGPTEIHQCVTASPYMDPFTPSSPRDVALALTHLPTGKPRTITLCRDSWTRSLPDYSRVDDTTPPFGPYQLPGESRREFFDRRERYRPDQERQETQLQKQSRHVRIAQAEKGLPPSHRSRMFLWLDPQLIYPDLPPHWAGYDYRHPIPPAAYQSLWMVHPADCRKYNAFYDEWDLWFPVEWGSSQDESSTHPHLEVEPIINCSIPAPRSIIHPPPIVLPSQDDLLIPAPEERIVGAVEIPKDLFLHSWYGLTLVDTRAFAGVDYDKWANSLWNLFGETEDRFPADESFRKCTAGWVSAVMQQDWRSRALEFTWDLDPPHPKYLLRCKGPDPRLSISLESIRVPDRRNDPDCTLRWVLVNFVHDPDDQPWSLLTSPPGALLLIRRLHEVDTSKDALINLVAVGIPVRSGKLFERPPEQAVLGKPMPSVRRLRAPWRKKGERPTLQDYVAYCQRVLEFSHRPHARAAWLKGGIVWRIMIEVTGKYPHSGVSATHLEELRNGPSGAMEHHEVVGTDSHRRAYYDNACRSPSLISSPA